MAQKVFKGRMQMSTEEGNGKAEEKPKELNKLHPRLKWLIGIGITFVIAFFWLFIIISTGFFLCRTVGKCDCSGDHL